MKKCTKCYRNKDKSQYHKDRTKSGGLYSSCKKCNAIYQKEYREKNQKKAKKYRKEYYSTNRKTLDAKNKQWAIDNPEKHAEIKQKGASRQRIKFPQKCKARLIAYRKRKELKKEFCERCCCGEDLHMHHEDCSKPLIVITLCRDCHTKNHACKKK